MRGAMTDGDDIVRSYGGRDTIYISPGSDFYDGGSDNDSLSARYYDGNVVVDLDEGTLNNGSNSTVKNVENYIGNSWNDYSDNVRGTNGRNDIRTYGGRDTVYISKGNDHYDGGEDHDILNASDYGSNRAMVVDFKQGKIFPTRHFVKTFTGFEGYEGRQDGNQIDNVTTGDGYNEIRTYNGNDTITISDGSDYYWAGEGIDTLSAQGFDGNVSADLQWRTVSTDLGNNIDAIDFENYEGNSSVNAADYVHGTFDRNVIKTFGGEDIVYLSQGNDDYDGGRGIDILDANSRPHVLGQATSMAFNMEFGSYSWNDGRKQHSGRAKNFEVYEGLSGNDWVLGTNGFNIINTYDGNDIISGMGGDDLINAGSGTNTVTGGDGNQDRVIVDNSELVDISRSRYSGEFLHFQGVDGEITRVHSSTERVTMNDDRSITSDWQDLWDDFRLDVRDKEPNSLDTRSLTGSFKNENFYGEAGRDILTGHGGADHFILNQSGPEGRGINSDVIIDFDRSEEDKIVIDKVAYGYRNGEDLNVLIVGSQDLSAALQREVEFVYDDSNGNLLWNNNGVSLGHDNGLIADLHHNQNDYSQLNLNTDDFLFV